MFKIFKKKEKEDPNSPAKEDWLVAKEQFEKGEYQNSLSTLIIGFKKDIYYRPLYDLSGNCLDKLGGTEESQLFLKAKDNLNPETFKLLGNHFYNAEHYTLTRIFLEESFKKEKDIEVANNLAIAYSRRFDTKKAQETLETVKNKFDFWTYWYYVKMKILNNDNEGTEQSIQELENAFDSNSNDENLIIPKQKVIELRESYERLKIVATPEGTIRDWQFIQYGTIILDFFFSEDQYVAGGRHVASWGNSESIKSILAALSKLSKDKKIDSIVYGNNRDSEIIGKILSNLSNIKNEVYDTNKIYFNSLMLVSDSTGFNEFTNVEYITNNNITFSFNHNWLQANIICPDIIGLMSQSYTFPWNGGNFKMNENGITTRTEADDRSPEIIAKEISDCEIKDITPIDKFYNKIINKLKMNQNYGHRYNFMIESPVPGSYFGSN